MARIRGGNTRPERILRSALWVRGLRYRLRYPLPAGQADLVFPSARLAVFIDGCFWHGCPEHYVRPRTRPAFWSRKLRTNVERDARQTMELEGGGWTVLRIWEHRVFTELESVITEVLDALSGPSSAELSVRTQLRVVSAEPLDEEENVELWTLVALGDPSRAATVRRKRSTRKW